MRKKSSNFPFYIILIVIVCLCVFIYFSPKFERTPPKIEVPSMTYWNLKWNVPIKISDSSGIKSYRVSIIKNDNANVILEKNINDGIKTDIEFNLPIPKINILNGDTLRYKIEAIDNSKYNFFLGNVSVGTFPNKYKKSPEKIPRLYPTFDTTAYSAVNVFDDFSSPVFPPLRHLSHGDQSGEPPE